MNIASHDFWYAILVDVLCGTIIGIERQSIGKPAGIRTSILICLGTTIFISTGIALAGPNTDTTRVLGQVVTGIGFLGAGVIMARDGVLLGITTAATIWILAGIGAVVALGKYIEAIALSLVAVGVLVGIRLLEVLIARILPHNNDKPHQ
jgi:putative Mg2+ transporter-C (MgtC) family protein